MTPIEITSDDPLSDAAIEALASLLLSLADPDEETQLPRNAKRRAGDIGGAWQNLIEHTNGRYPQTKKNAKSLGRRRQTESGT